MQQHTLQTGHTAHLLLDRLRQRLLDVLVEELQISQPTVQQINATGELVLHLGGQDVKLKLVNRPGPEITFHWDWTALLALQLEHQKPRAAARFMQSDNFHHDSDEPLAAGQAWGSSSSALGVLTPQVPRTPGWARTVRPAFLQIPENRQKFDTFVTQLGLLTAEHLGISSTLVNKFANKVEDPVAMYHVDQQLTGLFGMLIDVRRVVQVTVKLLEETGLSTLAVLFSDWTASMREKTPDNTAVLPVARTGAFLIALACGDLPGMSPRGELKEHRVDMRKAWESVFVLPKNGPNSEFDYFLRDNLRDVHFQERARIVNALRDASEPLRYVIEFLSRVCLTTHTKFPLVLWFLGSNELQFSEEVKQFFTGYPPTWLQDTSKALGKQYEQNFFPGFSALMQEWANAAAKLEGSELRKTEYEKIRAALLLAKGLLHGVLPTQQVPVLHNTQELPEEELAQERELFAKLLNPKALFEQEPGEPTRATNDTPGTAA